MKNSPEQLDLPAPLETVHETASLELVHSLLRFVRIARHRKKVLIQALCLSLLLGAAYYALAPRYFESSARLLIVQRNHEQLPQMGDAASSDNTMTTHQELVTSSIVIQEAIEHLLPEHRIDFQNNPPQQWQEDISKKLYARITRKTNIIQVGYRSLDPEAAAAVVSAIIQSYLQFVETTHHGSANEVIEVLTRERDTLQQSLAAKQQELQAFRQTTGHLAVRSNDKIVEPMIQRAIRLNDALMTAQEKRLELQASLATVQAGKRNSEDMRQHFLAMEKLLGSEAISAALGFSAQDTTMIQEQEVELLNARTELQSMAPYYGESHPRVAQLKDRIQSIELYLTNYRANASQRMNGLSNAQIGPLLQSMLEQSLAEAYQKEQGFLASFNTARAEAARQSGDIAQLQMLEREVERLEALHDILFSKIASVDMSQLQGPIQATVIQEPLPDDMPVSPQLRFVLVLSVLAAVAVGGTIAFVQDTLDDRFTSPEDITGQLGVPVLAMVRDLEMLEGVGLDTVNTFRMPTSAETETFRTLRTALTLNGDSCERILVSSAEPGDGKTTVTVNLAVSFAQSGKKTLIIDADLRKPGMTTLLNLKGQAGMADLLSATGDLTEAVGRLIRKTNQPGLDVLPAGLRRPNPAELLGSLPFAELLAWADSCYDQVLVDCPPVLAVSDAQVVGRLVDGAILVVRPEKNHRKLVARACDSFRATGSKVLGIVANGLTSETSGYGYGYGYGYGHDEEPTTDDGDAPGDVLDLTSYRSRSQSPQAVDRAA